MGPIYLGRATTALAQLDYTATIQNTVIYVTLNFAGSFFKECQSLVYLKVAQAAFVQLSEVSFRHLHSLSLDWHLKKKLGEVMRSLDRGILACDTLMKYLFLWLVPAIAECILVCVIFATYFDYFPLAVSVFYFVFCYMILTIVITLWRKKFRKQVAKSDNDWHDRATDSLVNFETVKFFTAENYEMERFGEAVETFQHGSVHVAASLSFLNISQQLLLQACLATSLVLSTLAIRDRQDCCIDNGCNSGDINCCNDLGRLCGGMEIGDFVAVLTYTLSLFMPLNFLGSVYNAIVMAMVDLTNLSEILAENPDVTDAPDAVLLSKTNAEDPGVAVEFDNVFFHYPSQSEASGLKGVSFKMKKGTINAVVGPTGAGKTTVSRLLFRFYDVLDGAVKVNGDDVRIVQQKSLRGSMGVVPQNTTLFNDTLRNNIRYGRRDATDEELDEVAEAAQLTTFIKSLPDGWDTMVGDRGLKLSGGEKQRVAIARCLLKNPPIVILDEATSALDTITENSVQEALDRLGNDRTVLVIAHRLGTIRHADNIIVLADGKVVEEGTHDELLAKGGIYADMWNMQLSSTKTSEASLGPLAVDE
jgi:ABC-type transport system involved in Fe-S cluster assembly fused permease/ATPase subunit